MAVKSSDPIDILLEMGIDLDNLSEEEDYLSALKEAIAIILVKTKGAGDERSKVLLDEVVKVRKSRKAADPTFKAKKTTIKPDAFFGQNKPENQAQPVPGQKALPGSGTIKGGVIVKPSKIKKPEKEEEKDTKLLPGNDILKDILRGVNSILGTLQNQNKFTKKQSEKDRKSTEKKKRGAQEDKLEKGALTKFAGGAKKLLKPVTNLFADILKFIGTVLIGRLLVKIINWMGDKDNKDKMDAIQDFFKVTWPAFLAVFLAFSLGLGGFITGLIGLVGGFALKIGKLIPMMLKGLGTLAMGNPITTAIVAGSALAAIGAITSMNQNEGEREEQNKKDDAGTVTPTETKEKGEMPKGPQLMEEMTRQTGMGAMFNSGGIVPGSGPNKDTVPAMLAPGEFVMSRGAVSKYGADTMESMNAMGGGTNRPMIKDGVTYAKTGGGILGPMPKVGKNRPGNSSNEDKLSSDEVVSEEKLSAEKANAKLLSFISSGEGGYNSMNQGTSGNSIVGSTHNASSILGKNLPQMTVGEVMQNQNSGKLFAAGRYQIIPNTMKMAVARAGVSSDDMFDSKTQDKLGLALIYNGQRPTLSGYLKGENNNVQGAMLDLAMEWASAPDPSTGKSYYGGANASSHTVEEVRTALTSAREQGAGKFMSAAPASSASLKGGGTSSSGGSGTGSGTGSKSKSGMSAKEMSDLFSGYKTIKKVNAGPSLLDLYNEQERFAGRPEGFKPGGLKFKKPPSSTSDLENNSRSTTNMQQKGAEGAGSMGNQSNASPNPAATNVAPSNDLPEIDANAMISQEKIKVLGITVV